MVVDPIRPSELPAATHAAPVQAAGVRPQTSQPSPSAVPPVAPPVSDPDEVKVKWDRSDGVIVTFTDKASGDIVRQIPSEQVLSVVRFIRQMLEEDRAAEVAGDTTGSEEKQ